MVVTIIAVMILILVIGGLRVHSLMASSFNNIEQIDNTLQTSADLLRAQLDEETGVRGYVATGNSAFLEPYTAAKILFPQRAAVLRTQLRSTEDGNSNAAFDDLLKKHDHWETLVERGILPNGPSRWAMVRHAIQQQFSGKLLVDSIRADFADIDAVLAQQRRAIISSTRASIDTVATFLFVSTLSFIFVGGIALRYQMQLMQRLEAARMRSREIQHELKTKQHVADLLQEALSQRPLPELPTVRFSATYVPATEQSKVGGDWYDAIELSHNRVLFIIGDVAGHGIEAAVGMSRARQAFIGSALKNPDPAHVLSSVNRELNLQGSPMVTAVCGVADSERYEFIYATAGHPPPLLVEPGQKPRFLQCGGLPLGVLPKAEYQTRVVQTVPGSMVVLYTDGAVEHSHDVLTGEALLIEAASLCHDDQSVDPATAMHKTIFADRPAGDDVAILTMGFTNELKTGMTISAEHLRTSFSGHIARMPYGVGKADAGINTSQYGLRAA